MYTAEIHSGHGVDSCVRVLDLYFDRFVVQPFSLMKLYPTSCWNQGAMLSWNHAGLGGPPAAVGMYWECEAVVRELSDDDKSTYLDIEGSLAFGVSDELGM
jgi:hypothetical protein